MSNTGDRLYHCEKCDEDWTNTRGWSFEGVEDICPTCAGVI